MTRLALAKALFGLTATLMMVANLLGCSGDAGVIIPPPPLTDAGPQQDARADADLPDAMPAAATPEFNPPPGIFNAPPSITLRTETAGAAIHYTLDGSTPDSKSPIYTSPIGVAKTTTIKAIARKTGFGDSAVRSGAYFIDIPPGVVEPVQFEPKAGDYSNDVEVQFTSATADAAFCYTLDGSAPSCDAQARCARGVVTYTAPVPISKSGQKIRAIACKKDMVTSSEMEATYNFSAIKPTFNPPPGSYDPHNPVPIAITSETRGAVIHYSVNGTAPPTCDSPDTVSANGTIPIITGDAIVQALTCKEGYATSEVETAQYLGTLCASDFDVTSRAQLEALARCEEITGRLQIAGATDLTDLAPLAHLRRVGGYLHISFNPGLTSLHGLEALTAVGGQLWVKDNASLDRIDSLAAIETVGDSLLVAGNAITEWIGPSSLTLVGGLRIGSEKSLKHVGGFSRLAKINGELLVGGNDALTAFDDMPALTTVTGTVSFSSNAVLERLSGFAAVHTLGNLSIRSNPVLTQFLAFSQAPAIGGELAIADNPKLAELDLKNVSSIGTIYLGNLPALTSLQALGGLTKVEGLATITGTLGFSNLAGLEQLTSIKGTLSINSSQGLTDLTGLTNLTSVKSFLSVWGNADLKSLRGLDKLGELSDGITLTENPALIEIGSLNALEWSVNSVLIASNPKLVRLDGLHRLRSMSHLSILDDIALEKLEGFEALTEVGVLEIKGCSALQNLTGLEALGKIAGNLDISGNGSLTQLDALGQFVSLGGHLTIAFNASLPMCQADRVFERLRAHGYGGLPDIRNNGGTTTCD
ncbi:chitobiase/beta-hexosaminidase C-terminal domain-containing protein [Pendulispora brunnea]|uniref:Chitobiase/beta-hexosaminidase C-terminal domain-containing protein n=1 Tax=Pendulispora brunnea TaxID=2905690 RepID=A0ABZ2KIZ0_9BACT